MKFMRQRRENRDAQTLVFFLLSFGTIFILCGLAIDSGLLYLAKAQLSRAVDGAALAAIGNFHQSDDPTTNQAKVATTMRNFAIANFPNLNPPGDPISSDTSSPTTSTYPLPNGQTGTTVTFSFNDGQTDSTGNYRRYVQIVLETGAGGQITSATCNARCPIRTYFMGLAGSFFRDLKVSSSAVATRNPRLIMVVVDRSGSMLATGGGAYGLPNAIVTFLNFFDTSADYIGIVSFSSNARLEMPLTTNFLIAGTNNLFDSYQIDPYNGAGIPGLDPEQSSDPTAYAAGGVRRLKFGGLTGADEGLRLAIEELMANPGFNNPDVVKYLVIFTDGAWNNVRTLFAAPGYTNIVQGPPPQDLGSLPQILWLSNAAPSGESEVAFPVATDVIPVPTLSPFPDVTNALGEPGNNGNFSEVNHDRDFWLSADGIYEPLPHSTTAQSGHTFIEGGSAGSAPVANTMISSNAASVVYTTSINVWLQPGSVDYVDRSAASISAGYPAHEVYVSNFNKPNMTQTINLYTGDTSTLIVPGYILDGLFSDELDMPYPDDESGPGAPYTSYRLDNYQMPFTWPDDTINAVSNPLSSSSFRSTSTYRALAFRNYVNLLTGFYIIRPDDPLSTTVEPLTGFDRPLNGNGGYYPGGAFYWPFDGVGINSSALSSLWDPTFDPDTTHTGLARKENYSINMLSPAANPEWAGELFYKGTGAALSGTTAASTLMSSVGDWQLGAPGFLSAFSQNMVSDPVHNTNLAVAIWRPASFTGSNVEEGDISIVSQSDGSNHTGGYVTDGAGHYYGNAMAYSSRPTHYYDFSKSTWVKITDNHTYENGEAFNLGLWKAQEYAWHARALGVKIYSVGYGSLVSPDEQLLLAQVANATNTTAGNPQYPYIGTNASGNPLPGSNIVFNPQQPIGQQFYANTPDDISNDFYQIGTAINAALTQ